MIHIDEQISQIYNFLSPFHSSINNNPSPISDTTKPSSLPPPLSLVITTTPSEINPTNNSPTVETPLLNKNIPFFDSNQSLITSPARHSTDYESTVISIPPPPSVYNRSASSSIVSLGLSTPPRGSVSNKIVPAPNSPKQESTTSSRPISNTRFTPGRSPKPKARSHQNRSTSKQQQQSEKSTIIELESPTNKTQSLQLSSSKSGSDIFRRYTDQTIISSSSTLLYPPTSDDERPISPTSSGNEDDDCRPLTSSTSKHHHQTLL
jgi:hypothetical protein